MSLVPVVLARNSNSAMELSVKQLSAHVDVVIAIITNQHEEILVAKRALHKHQGGLWEFPGGKVEPGESLLAALKREIHEELDLNIARAQPFMQLAYDYPERKLMLHVWQVDEYTGTACGKEGQAILWIDKQDIALLPFPDANKAILQRLIAKV